MIEIVLPKWTEIPICIMFAIMFILILIVGVKVIWWYFIKGNLWKDNNSGGEK